MSTLWQKSAEENAARFKYKVESGIVCPDKVAAGGRRVGDSRMYPLPLLRVDQSFFVPASDLEGIEAPWRRLAGSINSYHQLHPERFTWRTRTQAEHGEAGWRVWRIK